MLHRQLPAHEVQPLLGNEAAQNAVLRDAQAFIAFTAYGNKVLRPFKHNAHFFRPL